MLKCTKKLMPLVFLLLLMGDIYAQEIIQVAKNSESLVYLSHIAERVDAIYLSTSEVVLGSIVQVDLDKENIFISDVESDIIYRFNLGGKLVNFIGIGELRQAQGYNYISRFCVDSLKKNVLLLTDNGVYVYDYDGNLLKREASIKGREIRLIGEDIYVSNPQLSQSGSSWRAIKRIKIYNRENLKLKYNITYSNNFTYPFISVLRNRTTEFSFSNVGEYIYVYQPEFIGKLETLNSTVFLLYQNLLSPAFKLDFEDINSKDVLIKNIFLTQRYIFCEFERKSYDTSYIFLHDIKTGSGITTPQGFLDNVANAGNIPRLSPISTQEGLFYFVGKKDNTSVDDYTILYLVKLKR